MVVLVLQASDGATGIELRLKANYGTFEYARYFGAAAFFDGCARSRLLGVQQSFRGGARQVSEEETEQMVVSDLLNDTKGG